jgi:hypothetical protein
MNLSYKATQFIIEAIEYQIKAYQERLDSEDLDEDEASDIINDSGFLEVLCRDLRKNLNEGKRPDVLKSSDSYSVGIIDRSSEELVKQVLQLSMNERLLLVDAITESIRQEFQSRQAQESSGEHPDYVNVLLLTATHRRVTILAEGKAIHFRGAIASNYLLHFIKGRTV